MVKVILITINIQYVYKILPPASAFWKRSRLFIIKGSLLRGYCLIDNIDNKLSLHLGKTEAILFGSKRKLNSVQDFTVTCDDKIINNASSVKYLGVTLDNTVSGDSIYCLKYDQKGKRESYIFIHAGTQAI